MVTIPKWVDYCCFNHIRLFGGETDDEALELKMPDFQTDLHADRSIIRYEFYIFKCYASAQRLEKLSHDHKPGDHAGTLCIYLWIGL